MLDDRLIQNAVHFGERHQLWKLIEECLELVAATLALLILGKSEKRLFNFASEMADVHLMCKQTKYLTGIEEQFEAEKERKTERQWQRLQKIMENEK